VGNVLEFRIETVGRDADIPAGSINHSDDSDAGGEGPQRLTILSRIKGLLHDLAWYLINSNVDYLGIEGLAYV
jgi:hypothetical protein